MSEFDSANFFIEEEEEEDEKKVYSQHKSNDFWQ